MRRRSIKLRKLWHSVIESSDHMEADRDRSIKEQRICSWHSRLPMSSYSRPIATLHDGHNRTAFVTDRRTNGHSNGGEQAASPRAALCLVSHFEFIDRRACHALSHAVAYIAFKSAPFSWESGPHGVQWALTNPHPKRNLNRFIRFCRAHGHDQQTHQGDRHRDGASPSFHSSQWAAFRYCCDAA